MEFVLKKLQSQGIFESVTQQRVNLLLKRHFKIWLGALGLSMSIRTLVLACKLIKSQRTKNKWRKVIDLYNVERFKRIKAERQRVNDYDLNLPEEVIQRTLDATISELQSMLQNGEITSVQMLYLYMKRTLDIGTKNNYITETNFEEALQMATNCDNIRATNPQECQGEFFGIVISIKDSLKMKGTTATLGIASRLGIVDQEDGIVLDILKQAGAIPFVKSNVSQLLLTYEGTNKIFGTALNPWNKDKTTGGSSAGEAGLVASRCSPFGVGTDIGGSIRIPCSFSGLVGFKPGNHRLSARGGTSRSLQTIGVGPILSAIGPMSKYVEDSVTYMRTILNQDYNDKVKPHLKDLRGIVPWNESEYKCQKKMKIGYISHFNESIPCVGQLKANQVAIDSLEKQGHTVVPIEMSIVKDILNTYPQIMFGDGLQDMKESLKGEEMVSNFKIIDIIVNMKGLKRKLMLFIMKVLGQHNMARVSKPLYVKNAYEQKELAGQCTLYQQNVAQIFYENELDAIIMPTTGVPALTIGASKFIFAPIMYSMIWNLLQFPAGNVPIRLIQQDEAHYNNSDMTIKENREIHKNMVSATGLPVAIQVITLPMQEEKCLNIMGQIEKEVQFQKNYGLKI